MALAKTYGTTWWGQNWLASLTHIDYANRIPRGRSYANTGKVFDVEILPAQGRITAKVKGNYHPFYRVVLKFEQVNKEAKESFLSDLVKNITIVSKLTNRELDPSLLDLALKHHIKLFPSSWKDLGMTCNCPDSAVPCKHIAAVIYIVSEVIDSNPFYVFSLKGIDLLKELENRGFNLDEATRVETATFASLTRNSITTIENLCIQAQEFGMPLEPVIINRTVPLNWKPDFTQGSGYDVQGIVDVDNLTAKIASKSAPSDEGSDEQVAPSANESKSTAESTAAEETSKPKAKKRKAKSEQATDKSPAGSNETQARPAQESVAPAAPTQEPKVKSRRVRKPKAGQAQATETPKEADKLATEQQVKEIQTIESQTKEPKSKELLPLGAGVDKLCETVGKIIESDFELSQRKKKPGRKTKEALEQEQHQAYLRAKFGSLTVGQAFDYLNHNTGFDVFADGEDFAEVKLPQSTKAMPNIQSKEAKSDFNAGSAKAKRDRRYKSKA